MTVYRFHDCRVDAAARELRRADGRVAVAPRVFDLLLHLLAQRHRVVTKAELLETVWHGADVSESVIHRAMVQLREALGDGDQGRTLLRTVHRLGYHFVGEVSEQPATPAPAGPAPPTASPASARSLPAPSPSRLVMLPLENQSGEPQLDWACWGLPRLVCDALAGDRRLAVVDMDQVQQALDHLPAGRAGADRVGALLGARWVIIGRLLRTSPDACRLEYEVGGGPAGVRTLASTDPSALAGPLAQALCSLANPSEGWPVAPVSGDPLALQALARAQELVARADWPAAAHLLKVVLDIEPDNAAARLLWLRTLPHLHDASVFEQGERLLAEAGRKGDVRLQAATHEMLGRASFNRRGADWAVIGQRHLSQALELARPWAHEDWVVRIHLNLGFVSQLQRDPARALAHYEAAQRLLANGGNALYRVAALNNRALIECFQEQPLVARDLASQALLLCEQYGLAHAGQTCRATLALSEAELGWLGPARQRCLDNAHEIAREAAHDPESAAWALLVGCQVGLLMQDGAALGNALTEARAGMARASPRVAMLLAAVDALLPMLTQAMASAELTTEGLLEAIRLSEEGGFRDHSHHLVGLALELALRARSPRLLLRLRRLCRSLPTVAQDGALGRALRRADAAEALWRGHADEAVRSLEAAVDGPPAGRVQAWARLDLAWLRMDAGELAQALGQIAWVRHWVEPLPQALCLHARGLALQGQSGPAADAQLAALRLRWPQAPALWHAWFEAYAAGQVPADAAPPTLLTLT